MKKLFLSAILTIIFYSCFSQDLTGKWYMINRSGLIEFTITKDSIKNRKVFTDFKPKGEEESEAYLKTIKLEDRILLIARDKKDPAKFVATAFINLSDKKYLEMAWNAPDTATTDIETLIDLHKKDPTKLLGYTLFSEYYLDVLKQMKPVEDMSLADFKRYFTVYTGKLKATETEFNKHDKGYLAVFSYNHQLVTQSLYEIGFNPIQTVTSMNAIYKKYLEDPDVKKMIEAMSHK